MKSLFYTTRTMLILSVALVLAAGVASGAMRPTPDYLKSAVVYQIVLRNFTRDGNFKAATEMLDHVRDVGIDVVYLTPSTNAKALRAGNRLCNLQP